MRFSGFGFSGYRSFSGELYKIAPLKKVNFIIGQNNSGKSNIINFLNDIYNHFVSSIENNTSSRFASKDIERPFKDIDMPLNGAGKYEIARPLMKQDVDNLISTILENKKHLSSPEKNEVARNIKTILLSSALSSKDDEIIWFSYKSSGYNGAFRLDIPIEKLKGVFRNDFEWSYLWQYLTGLSGGGLTEDWIPETIREISPIPQKLPSIEVIPAIRKVGDAGTNAHDYGGNGIIERLAKIQNPALNRQEDKERFKKINKFLQVVLENTTAEIEIPHDRQMIIVHMDGKSLPLQSLGTGIHEVVILAAAATLLNDSIVCIEEPELHLHPLLQRKLVKYLSDSTTNQYFFTTHSAHLLDAVDEAEIFHVHQEDGVSKVTAISSSRERAAVCQDLGYKASDILQSNCIVWVEGPSDRIYLNYWIKAQSPYLTEGIHYSIMFYGGRLSSHLSALDCDEQVETENNLISLRQLNRNSVILIDSDRTSPQSRINQTKKRLRDEFNSGPGFAWITEGREIENYLDHDKVEEAIIASHPQSAKGINKKGKWENLLVYRRKNSRKNKDTLPTASKVKVATYYTNNNEPDLSTYDLNKKIDKLTKFIRQSNGM